MFRQALRRALVASTRSAMVRAPKVTRKPLFRALAAPPVNNVHFVVRKHARAYSTTQTRGVDNATLDVLLKKAQNRQVLETLQKQNRLRISYGEYLEVAKSQGLNEAEAKQLSKALHESGQILHFTQSPDLENTLIVKPAELTASFLKMLDAHGKFSHKFISDSNAKIAALQEELKPLEAQRDEIDKRAHAYADRVLYLCFGYLLLQGGAVARLTWWELSWDIMEPVTYMLTFGTGALAFTYFLFTKREYTYESLRERLARRRREKLFVKEKFDTQKYNSILRAIEEQRENLKAPELRLLSHVVEEVKGAAAPAASEQK